MRGVEGEANPPTSPAVLRFVPNVLRIAPARPSVVGVAHARVGFKWIGQAFAERPSFGRSEVRSIYVSYSSASSFSLSCCHEQFCSRPTPSTAFSLPMGGGRYYCVLYALILSSGFGVGFGYIFDFCRGSGLVVSGRKNLLFVGSLSGVV